MKNSRRIYLRIIALGAFHVETSDVDFITV